MSNRKLRALCKRAERLGVAAELAQVLDGYLDEVQRLTSECEAFRWGDPCDHVQIVPGHVDRVAYELGPLVAVVYEATKGNELAHWEHDFQPARPVLAWGASGKLLILGGDYTVTDRGIVG